MSKIVIIKNIDGSVSVLEPNKQYFDPKSNARKQSPELDEMSEEEVLQWIIDKHVPQGLEYRIANKSELPTDRVFRNAWQDNNGVIVQDITKAKEIKKNIFRALRKPLLEKLDAAYLQADEVGNTTLKAQIVQKKQTLRDVTKLTMPNTIEELKDFLPNILTKTEDTI